MFFIRQTVRQGNMRNYHILIYDSNENTNLLRVGRNFLSEFKSREASMYSNALHGLTNIDGRCGHYTWLEAYLYFDYFDNPFHRNLTLRGINNMPGQGHRGPRMFQVAGYPTAPERNRSIPRNQMSNAGRS